MVAEGYGFTLDFGTLGHGEPIKNSAGETFRADGYPLELKVLYSLSTPRDNINKKEKAMKKTEAKEQLEKLQVEVDRLREIVEQEDKKPWRAEIGNMYCYVNDNGHISSSAEFFHSCDTIKYAKGNYFQTKEEAEGSLIYEVLNGKWHYWVADVNDKPWLIPEDCEVLSSGRWIKERNNTTKVWNNSTRRWPKHS